MAFIKYCENHFAFDEIQTEVLNVRLKWDPEFQDAAKKCQYCSQEIVGPCAGDFRIFYKCVMAHDVNVLEKGCAMARHKYIKCVEQDIRARYKTCPMYQLLKEIFASYLIC